MTENKKEMKAIGLQILLSKSIDRLIDIRNKKIETMLRDIEEFIKNKIVTENIINDAVFKEKFPDIIYEQIEVDDKIVKMEKTGPGFLPTDSDSEPEYIDIKILYKKIKFYKLKLTAKYKFNLYKLNPDEILTNKISISSTKKPYYTGNYYSNKEFPEFDLNEDCDFLNSYIDNN